MRVVSLYADGQKRIVSTDATTVGDVLRRAGVTLASGDIVEPSAQTTVTQGFFNINVYRAHPVTVVDGDKAYHLLSAYYSPRLLAEQAGLKTYTEDHYISGVVTNFVNQHDVGIKVTIERSLPFTVRADGITKTYRAQPGTVGSALAAVGLKLGLQDTVTGTPDARLVAGAVLDITRVSEVTSTVEQILPAPVQKLNDPTRPVGFTQVKVAGSDGHQTVTYRIHYRDGVESSRQTLAITNRVEPTTSVVIVGTKIFFTGSVEYWRPMVEVAAAQYGLDPNMMLQIMYCESRGHATSVNSTPVGTEHATGLFQFLPSTWRSAGGTDANIFDGETQIQIAAKYMAKNGTSAWACSR